MQISTINVNYQNTFNGFFAPKELKQVEKISDDLYNNVTKPNASQIDKIKYNNFMHSVAIIFRWENPVAKVFNIPKEHPTTIRLGYDFFMYRNNPQSPEITYDDIVAIANKLELLDTKNSLNKLY